MNAPIVVFAFNRPDHLARTLQALAACTEARASRLTIYCDGARRDSDAPRMREVREVAAAAGGFAAVEVVARERNLGLAASIVDGVSSQLAQHGRVIVLEDDLVVSPHFIRYMNEALTLYEHDEQVASIHGYTYPVAETLPETFFLRGADCWGWATWARAWAHYRSDGKALLAELEARRLTRAFDLDGHYPFTGMLRDQIAGRNKSWAVRWHASAFLDGMLTLYPGRSLVQNIGHDGSGTHSGETDIYAQEIASQPITVRRQRLEVDEQAHSAFARFLQRRQGNVVRRTVRAAYHLLRRTA